MSELKPEIVQRKSIRKYRDEPFSAEEIGRISAAAKSAEHLFKDINAEAIVLNAEEYRKIAGGMFIAHAPYYIVIKSESKPGYLVNAGYLGENIVLQLTKAGIGTCFLGGAKSKEKKAELPYVISIALGKPDGELRKDESAASRKEIPEIASGETEPHMNALKAARLAPSGMNMQPVRYVCAPGGIGVFRKKPLLSMFAKMQEIDCGIAIANIVWNEPEYKFAVEAPEQTPAGCVYIGTLRK